MLKSILIAILLLSLSGNVYSNEVQTESISEIVTKLNYHKQILEDYENRSHVYGRAGLDIQSHTKANIRYYEDLLKQLSAKIEE